MMKPENLRPSAAKPTRERNMFFYNDDIELTDPAPGIHRKVLAHDDGLMICEFLLDEGTLLASHTHPNKQITYVVHGHLRYTVGDETREVHGGDSVLIPPNIPHEILVLEDTLVVDTFTPARADFL
jgi:quercetin dioxygenase-like cupin family protein